MVKTSEMLSFLPWKWHSAINKPMYIHAALFKADGKAARNVE